MTTWPLIIEEEETYARADIVLEGTIAHVYRGLIPGVSPRMFGLHWLLESSSIEIISVDPHFREIWMNTLQDIGFWAFEEDFRLDIGERVRVSLVLHMNDEGYLTLMPIPCSYHSVIDVDTGEPVLLLKSRSKCPPNFGKVISPPVRYRIGIFEPMASRVLAFEWAAKQWANAGGPGYEVRIYLPPPLYEAHYGPGYVNSIPPKTTKAPEPLARTIYDLRGKRPRPGSLYPIMFNLKHPWCRANRLSHNSDLPVTGSGEFDFDSVLLHELGHALGVAHLDGSPSNVMYNSFSPEEVRRKLTKRDKECMKDLGY